MGRRLYQNTWEEVPAGKPNDLLNRADDLLNRADDLLNC